MRIVASIFFTLFQLLYNNYAEGQCKDSSYLLTNSLQNGFVKAGLPLSTYDGGTMVIFYSFLNNIANSGIAKYKNNGELEWNKVFTATMANESFSLEAATQFSDGSSLINGYISYPISMQKLPFFVLLKLDVNGNILWQYKYKNNYDFDFSISNILTNLSEGKNGDVIAQFHNNMDDYIVNFSDAGVVRWSNRYRKTGAFFLDRNYTPFDGIDALIFWGMTIEKTDCFNKLDQEGLTSFKIDYTSGDLLSGKKFCKVNGLEEINYKYGILNNMGSYRLDDGNRVVFMQYNLPLNHRLLINKFDKNNHVIASKLFSPGINILKDTSAVYYCNVNKKTGEIVVAINFGNQLLPFDVLPYNFLLYLDSNLSLKRELFIRSEQAAPLVTFPEFKLDNKLGFLFSQSYTGLNNSSFVMANVPLDFDTSGLCFLKDSLYGTLTDYTLVEANNPFSWDEVLKNSYTQTGDAGLIASSLPFQQTLTCKKISICDTLKLHGSTNICLSKDTFQYSVYKNPLCLKKVIWKTDTSIATILKTVNDTTIKILFKKPGTIKLYASLEDCVIKDSLSLSIATPKTFFKIDQQDLLCPGKNLLLQSTAGFKTYQWSNGSNSASQFISQPGWYKATATDSCGNIFKDSILVKLIDTGFVILPVQKICLTDTLYLPFPSHATGINWQPNSDGKLRGKSLLLYPMQNTLFTLSYVAGKNCPVQKSLALEVVKCPETVFFPNSFTPNKDGVNDVFKPGISQPLQFYHVVIYNRYGQKVFESTDAAKGWNGSFKNMEQSTGTYIWDCSYRFRNRQTIYRKGMLLLLR